MLMTEPTLQMLAEWKAIWAAHKDQLKPNRKTGAQLLDFLFAHYALTELHDPEALDIIVSQVLDNTPFAEKLAPGEKPLPRAFIIDRTGAGQTLYANQDAIFCESDIFVGVDLASGCCFVEGSSLLWDELCAFQGLDKKDIENFFCVAEYIACLKRFGMLEKVLGANQ